MAKKPTTTIKDVASYLKEIGIIARKGSCVYRGEADASWPLRDTAERRVWDSLEEKEKKALSADKEYLLSTDNMVDYNKDLLQQAELNGFRRIDGRDLSDLELLAELRHFGAATSLLDFTDSALVALYFACQSEGSKDGRVFILHHKSIPTISSESEIFDLLEDGEVKFWRPAMQGRAESRITRQSGIFLINLTEDNKNLELITVKAKYKKKILKELDLHCQINANTLFLDLSGFAQNQASTKDLSNYWIYFYKGNAKFNQGQYKEAINDYTESIDLKPDFANAYNNRGNAKSASGQYKEAISDYDEAIRLEPDYALAYYNRGTVKDDLGQYKEAISDYDEAIRLEPDYVKAYNNRGIANGNLGQYEEAISDFNEAINLKPEDALVHYNRGEARFKLGDNLQALDDFERSKSLPKEQRDLWIDEAAQKFIEKIEELLKSSEGD